MSTGSKPSQLHVNVPPDLYASFRLAVTARKETVTEAVIAMMRTYVGQVSTADMVRAINSEQTRLDSLKAQIGVAAMAAASAIALETKNEVFATLGLPRVNPKTTKPKAAPVKPAPAPAAEAAETAATSGDVLEELGGDYLHNPFES